MRSPLRSAGGLLNRAPVHYTPARPSRLLGLLGRGGSTQQMSAMGGNGTLFAIVNAKSEAVGQAEWKLYRKAPSGRVEDRTEIQQHLALKVLNRPNKFMTRQHLFEMFSQHLNLTGEGWILVERDGRATFPLGLWPVRPDRMDVVPDPEEFIAGYVYSGPDGEKVPLGVNDVIRRWMPNPLDPHRGMGPVQSILVDLDSVAYSAEWNRAFFRNSAEPGGMIEVPEVLGDTEFSKLHRRWNAQHRGVSAAHRVSILEGGMKWVDRKYTNRDMQFVELRGVSREIIREAFRFPKAMLGTVDDVNRANAEANEVVFARWLVKSDLERIKQMLNNDFLPMFGSTGVGVEFDYTNPVPDDAELQAKLLASQSSSAQQLISAGLDPADVLNAVGLPPMRSIKRAEGVPQ